MPFFAGPSKSVPASMNGHLTMTSHQFIVCSGLESRAAFLKSANRNLRSLVRGTVETVSLFRCHGAPFRRCVTFSSDTGARVWLAKHGV